jgi:hypothetical protein
MIARRECDHAALPLCLRQLRKTVACTPQFERIAGLQAFAFQPDPDATDLAFDQRRALDETIDPFPRFDNILALDSRRLS